MMTRKDYIETAKILNYVNQKTHPAVFSKMVIDFAVMFAKDNPKFDANKFYKACGYNVPQLTTN